MQELVSSETLNNEEEIIVFEENLKGPKGENGATFTPNVSETGNLSWTNDKNLENPETVNIRGPQGLQGIQGTQGLQGDKGEKGDDGYTPVKGTDYFTEADKQEFIEAVTEDASSNFVQIVNSKTTEFNNNATSKTDSFNSNATSKETSYNDNATAKLNEYNENHTIKMTAYNENSAEKLAEFNENAAEKLEEYDEHIEDLDNIVSKNTVNGESIYIDDALAYKIFGTKIDGNAEQVTTTGKNYFNAYAIKNTSIVIEDDGQSIKMPVVTSGNGVQSTNSTLAELCPHLNVGDQVILRFNRNLGNTKNNFIYLNSPIAETWNVGTSKTITEEMLECIVQLYGNRYTDGETSQCIITDFTIMKTSETNTDFEQFTNNEPSPNPDYPQLISVVSDEVKMVQTGKNLFNNVNYGHLGFWVQSAGQNTTMAESESYLSAYCKVRPGETYTISREVISNRFAIAACDEVPNVNTTALVLAVDSDAKSLTVTVPDGYSFLVMYLQNDGTYEDVLLQIEEGTVATDYEEYKSNEYDIDLQDNELVKLTDDIKDTVDIDKSGNVSLNKRIGKVILNGTESWFLSNVGSYQVFGLTKSDVAKNILISDRFTYYKQVNNIKDREGISNDNTKQRIYISNGTSSTVEDFKAWLSENNVTVYYELAEPTTSSLGQLTNFKTFASVNHFFLEANLATNFEIRYAQDLQKVISKQQSEIDELKTLLSSTATSALLLDNYANDLMEEV